LGEAEELADRIAIIRAGKIIANGTAAELKEQLLGPSEFKAQLAEPLNGRDLPLPPEMELIDTGPDWFTVRVEDPEDKNPTLLMNLIEAGFSVVKLEEIQRSLESVYLQAVGHTENSGDHDVD
jgi:ABC-2 type transport system ATP-binding protein